MSVNREQLDKPTFKGLKCRRRWSYSEQKTAFNRALRREARRDPEGAPRKRLFHGWYWSILLLCFACGCVPHYDPVPPPEPEPTADTLIDTVGQRFSEEFRQTCLDAAARLRTGEWKTDRQYRDGHKELVKAAVEPAGQPFADRQQAEAMPFDPVRMADWLERMAREGGRE